MKLSKHIYFGLLVFITTIGIGQELIPKIELFDTVNIDKVGYLSKENLVIYTTSNKPNTLSLIDPQSKEQKEIKTKCKIVSYLASDLYILALTSDGKTNFLERVNIINNKVSSIKTPSNLIPFKLITQSKGFTNKIVLQAYNTQEKSSNFYQTNINKSSFNFDKIPNPENLTDVFFDTDLDLVAGSKSNDLGGTSLYIKTINNDWKEVSKNPWDVTQFLGGFQKILSVSSNGNEIYFLDNSDSDKTKLKLYKRNTDKITSVASSDFGDILPFGFSKNKNNQIASVVTLYDKTYRYSLNKTTENDFSYIEKELKSTIGFVDSNETNSIWIVRTISGKPSDYYTFDRSTKKLMHLFNEFPELKKFKFANRKGYAVKTSDNLSLPVHIYLPLGSDKNDDGVPDQPLPTVMYAHGGPWVGVVQWNGYNFWKHYQLLANRGYAVVVMEFRGSSGYGKEFIDTSNNQWGKKMLDDKIEITNWAIEKGIADKNKLAIWGWSYGGYATLSALAFKPKVFACGISMYPLTDLEAFMKLPQYGETNLWNERVGNSKTIQGQELLKYISPINHINKIKKPLLLTTGAIDKMVPVKHVDAFAQKLHQNNKKFSYLVYDKEGHDYSNLETWLTFWNAGEEFLQRYLGGKAELSTIPESYQNIKIKHNNLNLKIR